MTVTRTFLDQWKPQRKDDSFDQGDPSSELAIARKSALLWVQWWLVPYLNESPLYDQPNGRCHGSCARARVTVQITEALLARTVEDVAGNVRPWPAGRFKLIKTLQDAPRSHGKVDMMLGEEGSVAVKVMPNWWLKLGPTEFKTAYPHETEFPWRDMSLVLTLNAMRFAHACDFYGVFRDGASTFFVTSLASEGDLFSWSSVAPKPGEVREKQIKTIMIQICSAVKTLHEIGVAHRDLSLENILLNDHGGGDMQVKIIDYSMASIARKGVGYKHGKSAYKAPEMFRKHEYDFFLSDAFALGVVLYAMAWQRYPWKSTQPGKDEGFTHAKKFGIQSLDQNKDKSRPVSVYSTAMYGILEGLLAMEPGTRLHLGESCYRDDEAGGPVWATEWL